MKLIKKIVNKSPAVDHLTFSKLLSDGLWTLTHLDDAQRFLTYYSDSDLTFVESLAKKAIANGTRFLAMIQAQRVNLKK